MPIETNKQSQNSNVESKGETIDELAHRHMKDENHTVTDEEIRNAKIDLDTNVEIADDNLFEVDNETVIPPLPTEVEDGKDDSSEDKDDDDDDNESTPPNPYSVLS